MNCNHLAISTAFLLALAGCDRSAPECASDSAKEALISLIKRDVVGNQSDPWFIDPKFEVINTVSKSDDSYSCYAQIKFNIPAKWDNPAETKLSANYSIRKNENEKGSYSVTAKIDLSKIIEFNNMGWKAQQHHLFKKADVDFLIDADNDRVQARMESEVRNLEDHSRLLGLIDPKNIHKKLLDKGWSFDADDNERKMSAVYSKDNFVIRVNLIVVDIGTIFGKLPARVIDDANIWER